MNKLTIFVVIYIIFSVGCIQKKKTDNYELATNINTIWGKKLILDDSLFDSYCVGHVNKKFRIVSILDGDCSCSVETLERWQEYRNTNELIARNTEIIIFMTTEREFFVHEEIFKKIAPNICLIFDPNNTFTVVNNLTYTSNNFMTFLIDSTKTVKLVGNPLLNKEIKKLYQNYLSDK